MKKTNLREVQRIYRHNRIRKTVVGKIDRPRLCVHRSLKHLQAQIVDDANGGKSLVGLSTKTAAIKDQFKNGGNIKAAELLGELFAEKAKEKGIKKVCFDRGGYLYHGRVKAFAEAARKGGLEF
ncbi:MAG: 50S ribosomal protein L18 [Candidatus Omnitrophica bacterium]|nr:50S ribosomal protein L18 [Candidatus Omnitrophota bacterium]